MKWHHKWGSQLKAWQKMIEEGKDPPLRYYEQPDIPDYLMFYWTAFHELGTERQSGMGAGPIPRSKIIEYALEFELYGDRLTYFEHLIRSVDIEYVVMVNEPKKTPGKKEESHYEVAANDAVGMRQLFTSFQKRAERKFKKQVH